MAKIMNMYVSKNKFDTALNELEWVNSCIASISSALSYTKTLNATQKKSLNDNLQFLIDRQSQLLSIVFSN